MTLLCILLIIIILLSNDKTADDTRDLLGCIFNGCLESVGCFVIIILFILFCLFL